MKYIQIVYLITMWTFKKLSSVVNAFVEDPLKETGQLLVGVSAWLAIIGYILTLFGEDFLSKFMLLIFAPVLGGFAAMIYLVVGCNDLTEPWILRKRNSQSLVKGWAIQIAILTISMVVGGWMYLDGMCGFIIHWYKGESWWLTALELTVALPVLFTGLSILQETIWRIKETFQHWDEALSSDEGNNLETQP